MTRFFEVKKNPVHYFNLKNLCGTIRERGLDGDCESGGKHDWLVYPAWAQIVKEGGKSYLLCLKCNEHSHL